MASYAQLLAVSSDDSSQNEEGTRSLTKPVDVPRALKKKAPPPSSSPNPPSTPYGKTHAGEVHRRTDQRSDPLPAPGVGQSSFANSTNRSSRRQRRPNGFGHGNDNGDSDSEDDRKRPRRHDGLDGDSEMIGRRKRPVLPSSSHAEASEPSPSEFNDNRDEDERLHHSMQQALAFVGNILRDYTSPETQQARLAHLIRSTPSHLRPGAMRSETYDSMLSYLSRLKEKEVRSNATALMRQQISASSEPEPTSPVVQDELMKIVRSGKIEFKFVQLSHQPHFIRDLPGFYESLRPGQRHLPIVLRVLVKENTPRYVEVVDKSLLADLGWQYSFKTETWRQNMVNQDKLSGDVIYQREITGHITKMWEVTDADSDWRFGAFKEAERERIEKRKVKIEEREEEMLSVEE